MFLTLLQIRFINIYLNYEDLGSEITPYETYLNRRKFVKGSLASIFYKQYHHQHLVIMIMIIQFMINIYL